MRLLNNNNETMDSLVTNAAKTNDLKGFSQPVWQFVLLSVLTFGIYDFYWYYRNWKNLKMYKDLNIDPIWRTIGTVVPILGLFLIYSAHKDYQKLIIEEGVNRKVYPGLIVLVIILTGLLVNLPDPYWMLCFLSIIPLAIVQDVLNELWKKVQPDFVHNNKLNGKQITLVVIGAIWWILAILGMLIPE